MLKIAKTWNFTEAMRNLKEKSASTIQKYLRGYTIFKNTRNVVNYYTISQSLHEVDLMLQPKQLKIKEDL